MAPDVVDNGLGNLLTSREVPEALETLERHRQGQQVCLRTGPVPRPGHLVRGGCQLRQLPSRHQTAEARVGGALDRRHRPVLSPHPYRADRISTAETELGVVRRLPPLHVPRYATARQGLLHLSGLCGLSPCRGRPGRRGVHGQCQGGLEEAARHEQAVANRRAWAGVEAAHEARQRPLVEAAKRALDEVARARAERARAVESMSPGAVRAADRARDAYLLRERHRALLERPLGRSPGRRREGPGIDL